MTDLLLRRASVSRSSGQWSEDDFDVYAGERRFGRVFKADGTTEETPWMWTIVFHERKAPGPHQGFAPSREEAMAAFKASWEYTRL